MTTPIRMRLRRHAGFNLQQASRSLNGLAAVNVARPGCWGNPWRIVNMGRGYGWLVQDHNRNFYPSTLDVARRFAVFKYRRFVRSEFGRAQLEHYGLEHLRGKNLACWCRASDPCHADVLLELVNQPRET